MSGSLQEIVNAMTGRPVLVVGDVMLDRFVYGDAERLSPESPVPVLSIRNEILMPGGAGNVLANLAGLGASARIVAVTGEDQAANDLRRLITAMGASAEGLVASPDRPTTLKTRFLAAHQQLLRTDYERAGPLPETIRKKIMEKTIALIPGSAAVILSDYGKGLLDEPLIRAVIETARIQNIPVLVDPKKKDYAIYKGATLVTPNRKELSEATGGMPVKTDEEVIVAARKLIETSGIESVLATRSQDGMTIVGDGEPVHLRTRTLEVFDVSGAGDTVIATVAAALAAGADLKQAAAIANAAGGIVVSKVGTAPVRRAELLVALEKEETDIRGPVVVDTSRYGLICNRDEAVETVRRWKSRGLRVGFTNGCFDILHPGHVGYLNRARDLCDRLIVGVNTDESVRRLKGPERPVNDETSRMAVLAALGAVDMVVPFGDLPAEDDKPVRLIQSIGPHVFFKGGDYREDDLPEATAVRAQGGEVMIMPLYEGHSTTAAIKRMRRQAG